MNAERPFPPELWEQIPAAVQGYIRALEVRVTALETAVQRLETTVQELKERVHQDSRTSSRPPSSDPPQVRTQRPRHDPSGRRPGGQLGHEGQTRALLPVEEVASVVPVKPGQCRRCQHPLQGEEPQPQRHQVVEIPPVKPVVTEYPWHRWRCPVCGASTRAELPAGVLMGGFGPRVQAITALCTGAYHRSKRATQQVMTDLCGLPLSIGTLVNLEEATAQAVAEPVAEARTYVQAQPAA